MVALLARRRFSIVGCWLVVGIVASANGQSATTMQSIDPWGKFSPGTRKRVRLVVQKLDSQGRVVSTTTRETQSFLEEVTKNGYRLRVETTTNVAGKRIATVPQIVRRGYQGEVNGETSNVKATGETKVIISGVSIPCRVRDITIQGTDSIRVSHVHFSAKRFPHVIHRVTKSPAGGSITTVIRADTIALDMPLHLLGAEKTAAHILTTQRSPLRIISTLEVHCADVPGSLVSLTSTTRDNSGKVTERSQLDLVSYRVVIGNGRQPASRPRLRLFQRPINR